MLNVEATIKIIFPLVVQLKDSLWSCYAGGGGLTINI